MKYRLDPGTFAGLLVILAVAIAALLLVLGMRAHAGWKPEYAQLDPSTREWFRGLKNDYGMSCCDLSDGNRVDDPDWRQDAGEDGEPHYSVKLFDQWWPVDPKKVLHGSNRVGYAILWRPQTEMPADSSAPPIYCFLPGQTARLR